MKHIEFAENKDFFKKLDKTVKNTTSMLVKFNKEKIDKDSKLWPRLRNCSNWKDFESELRKLQARQDTPVENILHTSMKGSLIAGGARWLIAFIAALIAALISYGTYRKCKVRFDVETNKDGTKKGGLIFEPAVNSRIILMQNI